MDDITVQFQVRKDQMDFALDNLPSARKLDGVKQIKIEEQTNTFKLAGETDKAVHEARSMLGFREKFIQVPQMSENEEKLQFMVGECGVPTVMVFII